MDLEKYEKGNEIQERMKTINNLLDKYNKYHTEELSLVTVGRESTIGLTVNYLDNFDGSKLVSLKYQIDEKLQEKIIALLNEELNESQKEFEDL